MGLDITAYSNIKITNYTGYNYDTDEDGDMDYDIHVQFYLNPHYPNHVEGISNKYVYEYEDSYDFRAGSYGGYFKFREELAKLAGYPVAINIYNTKETGHFYYVTQVANSGPFYELINFSDCEGTISHQVCQKLYDDFIKFKDIAMQDDKLHPYYQQVYNDFITALELAKNNGALSFH